MTQHTDMGGLPRGFSVQTEKPPQSAAWDPGRVQWHCSEEDGPPDVGTLVVLGNGRALWIGELSRDEGDCMGMVVYGDNEKLCIAKLADYDEVRDLIEYHIAPALRALAKADAIEARSSKERAPLPSSELQS